MTESTKMSTQMRIGTGRSPDLSIIDKSQLKSPLTSSLQSPNLPARNLIQKRNTSSAVDDQDFSEAFTTTRAKFNAAGTPNTVKNTLMAAKARDANFTPGKFWERAQSPQGSKGVFSKTTISGFFPIKGRAVTQVV